MCNSLRAMSHLQSKNCFENREETRRNNLLCTKNWALCTVLKILAFNLCTTGLRQKTLTPLTAMKIETQAYSY